jgi:hypothetical protein
VSGGDWDALKRRKRERDRERAITVRLLSKFNNEPAPYPIPIGRVVASVLVITGAALLGLVCHALGQPPKLR